MNIKHLYYFYVFAQELSLTKAAKQLHITPPALSNQLKHFQASLRGPLVRRERSRTVLTDEGKRVLYYANRIFPLYEELIERTKQAKATTTGRIRIGVSQKLDYKFSIDLLSQIVTPDVFSAKSIELIFDTSNRLFEAIKSDRYDLIIGSFPKVDVSEGKFHSQSISLPVRLFVPKSFAKALRTRTNLTQVIEMANRRSIALALPESPSILRHEIDRQLLNSRAVISNTIECNSASALVELIRLGRAIGFLPTPSHIDLSSIDQLSDLGPKDGYWSHDVSVLMQRLVGRVMIDISTASTR